MSSSPTAKLVTGLQPGDFEVLDNGVAQTVDLASFEEIPLNVVLALDMSASLEGRRLGHLRIAGSTAARRLEGNRPGRAGDLQPRRIAGVALTSDFDRVRAALKESDTSGQTSLVDASFMGMMIGESDVGRSLLIVFSDGVDTRAGSRRMTSWRPRSAAMSSSTAWRWGDTSPVFRASSAPPPAAG